MAEEDEVEIKGGGEGGAAHTHKMNMHVRKKKFENEKRKILIDKIAFHYVALDSKEQQVAKAPSPRDLQWLTCQCLCLWYRTTCPTLPPPRMTFLVVTMQPL